MQKQHIILLMLIILASLGWTDIGKFQWPKYLSEWNVFDGELSMLQPAENAIQYDVNSPLFSDYAHKQRLIILPKGEHMQYREEGPLELPEGTILAKTFYYPRDFSEPEVALQVMETRIMLLKEGEWKAAAYEWNKDQTDARIAIGGSGKNVSWKDDTGKNQTLDYAIPNANQCTNCHISNGVVKPLGITTRQLNHNKTLQNWHDDGLLTGLPSVGELPSMPNYLDPSDGNLETKARAYLDVNCAHCHRPEGPANSSGLYLQYTSKDDHQLGIMKSPIAAGRGSGGKKYNIVPGKPKSSILLHRMESDDPGVRMPELGRQIPHKEGIQLIRDWIKSMK